jgi:hypothetical protein
VILIRESTRYCLAYENVEDSANLRPPDAIAQEIVEDLEAALQQFAAIQTIRRSDSLSQVLVPLAHSPGFPFMSSAPATSIAMCQGHRRPSVRRTRSGWGVHEGRLQWYHVT